jgi:Flp pilus assembly pilin Flp
MRAAGPGPAPLGSVFQDRQAEAGEIGTRVTASEQPSWQFSLSTVWERSRQTPLRRFLRTETGSAAVLLAATIAALIWANASYAGYTSWWDTTISIRLGHAVLSDDLLGWVNSGLAK